MSALAVELIDKKKRGEVLTPTELKSFFTSYQRGELPDYQMAAFLMAAWFNPLSLIETQELTRLMKNSGACLDFSKSRTPVVDKHSTGGIGDKTSLILNPLLAAAGLCLPMMAGRGLSFTGGTLDKLESIEGFNVHLNLSQFREQVEQHGFALIGQTEEICPLDKKLYALRDVTGTVDSIPLICASILSKKLAEGARFLVMDVKFGSGAFMKSFEQATALAEGLIEVAGAEGLAISALITNMHQPLGAYIGNAVEVHECLEIMKGQKKLSAGVDLYQDTRELTLELSAEALVMSNVSANHSEAMAKLSELLNSGAAFEKFCELCRLQGAIHPEPRLGTKYQKDILCSQAGYLSKFDGEQIGLALIDLGGGRLRHQDQINHRVGIELKKKLGQKVERDEPLFTLFADDLDKISKASERLLRSFEISDIKPPAQPLIASMLRGPNVKGDLR